MVAADVVAAAQAMVEGITGSRSVAVGEAVDMVAVATEVVVDTVEEVVAEVMAVAVAVDIVVEEATVAEATAAAATSGELGKTISALLSCHHRIWKIMPLVAIL